MGSSRNKDSSPMNKALILAATSLVGLEVDAHLRDSSIYSGIFFAASFDNGFSIVLKNARMTKKGNSNSNVAISELVATLVILSGDLIQVVAKGGQFGSNGEAWNSGNNSTKLVEKENGTTKGTNAKNDQTKLVEEKKETIAPKLLPSSTSITPVMTVDSKSGHISKPNKTAKESKLNPRAKMFIPTVRKPANPTVPTVASGMGYVPNRVPSVGPTMASPEFFGFSPVGSHSSVPVKVLPYGNLPAGPVGPTIAQYSQPIVGHLGNRQQPIRVGGPYPIQAGHGVLHPNPQPIMVGRPGQVAYVHPAPLEAVQGVPFPRPIMAPHHQLQFPKHQGQVMQQQPLYMAPYPIAAAPQQQQPYSMPHNIPILQPNFVSNRYVQVPGTNGVLNAKFL